MQIQEQQDNLNELLIHTQGKPRLSHEQFKYYGLKMEKARLRLIRYLLSEPLSLKNSAQTILVQIDQGNDLSEMFVFSKDKHDIKPLHSALPDRKTLRDSVSNALVILD